MILDILQYVGSVFALLGAWLVGSSTPTQRSHGFSIWIFSNLVLLLWAILMGLPGIGIMYLVFTITSARGWINAKPGKRIKCRLGLHEWNGYPSDPYEDGSGFAAPSAVCKHCNTINWVEP